MKKKICALLLLGACLLSLSACGNKVILDDAGDFTLPPQLEEVPESRGEEEIDTPDEDTAEDTEGEEADGNGELVDGMRPEFKEAMDSYEAFYDEYCDILKKYAANPADMELLADYADMLKKGAEMTEKFDAWENGDLNNRELEYYLDVNNRVTKKLLEVAE